MGNPAKEEVKLGHRRSFALLALPPVRCYNFPVIRMKRRFHWSLPAGFLLVLAGMLTVPIFANIPATRDFAWLNLLLLGAGVILLLTSLARAIRQPQLFRGKILGG